MLQQRVPKLLQYIGLFYKGSKWAKSDAVVNGKIVAIHRTLVFYILIRVEWSRVLLLARPSVRPPSVYGEDAPTSMIVQYTFLELQKCQLLSFEIKICLREFWLGLLILICRGPLVMWLGFTHTTLSLPKPLQSILLAKPDGHSFYSLLCRSLAFLGCCCGHHNQLVKKPEVIIMTINTWSGKTKI